MRKNRETIVVKIGADYGKDLAKIFDNPAKAEKEEPDFTLYVDSFEHLASILTAKKLMLMKLISKDKNLTIQKIAEKLGRKQEAISRDIHLLESFGLIKLNKEGTKVMPEMKAEQIAISLTH